jgi:hypothetical protein
VPAIGVCDALAGAAPPCEFAPDDFEFAPDEFEFAPEDEVPDVAALDCFPLLPFCAFEPELVLFGLPVGCCGAAVAFEVELLPLLLLFPLLLASLPLPAELFGGAEVCCGAEVCWGVGGGLAGGAGTLAGPDTPASSNAANGCASVFWLCADACAGDGEVSETAVEALGAILDTLGTLELREATESNGLLATGGPLRYFEKV